MNIKGWPERREHHHDCGVGTFACTCGVDKINTMLDECAKAVEGQEEIRLDILTNLVGQAVLVSSYKPGTPQYARFIARYISNSRQVESLRPSSPIDDEDFFEILKYRFPHFNDKLYSDVAREIEEIVNAKITVERKIPMTDKDTVIERINHANKVLDKLSKVEATPECQIPSDHPKWLNKYFPKKVEATTGGKVALDDQIRKDIIASVRTYWSFNEYQQHTHTWHSRGDFIEWLNKYWKDKFTPGPVCSHNNPGFGRKGGGPVDSTYEDLDTDNNCAKTAKQEIENITTQDVVDVHNIYADKYSPKEAASGGLIPLEEKEVIEWFERTHPNGESEEPLELIMEICKEFGRTDGDRVPTVETIEREIEAVKDRTKESSPDSFHIAEAIHKLLTKGEAGT